MKAKRSRIASIAATLAPGPRLGRMLMREQVILHHAQLLASGVPRERALRQAAGAFLFKASSTSLRRWQRAYERAGFLGLAESKLGRVGRKPKATQ